MSHCQGDAVWGAPSCAGQWSLPLCSAVLYQDISTAYNTTVFGLHSIWALDSCWIPLLSGGLCLPWFSFPFFFFFLVLLLPLCPTMRMGPIQFHCVPLSLELGHLSPCIYWLMFWCQLANLERNWSYFCQTVKGAVITRRNGIFGSASAPLYYPSGKFQNFFQYLGSKEIFQLHLAKVILSPFFFILIALLGYHLHAIKVLHFKCTNSIIFY